SAELQMPFWFLPKEVGLKGAVYADVGQLSDYKGPPYAGVGIPPSLAGRCSSVSVPTTACLDAFDDNSVRSSVGVGLIWQSPFGPLRFDNALPLPKGPFDRVQEFRFGGGTTF